MIQPPLRGCLLLLGCYRHFARLPSADSLRAGLSTIAPPALVIRDRRMARPKNFTAEARRGGQAQRTQRDAGAAHRKRTVVESVTQVRRDPCLRHAGFVQKQGSEMTALFYRAWARGRRAKARGATLDLKTRRRVRRSRGRRNPRRRSRDRRRRAAIPY